MLMLMFMGTASALTSGLASPKSRLQEFFEGRPSSLYVDPETKEPLTETTRFVGSLKKRWTNPSTGVVFAPNDVYLDFVAEAPSLEQFRKQFLNPTELVQVQTFRSPLTAFLYERGWRDSFTRNGFPGPDDEFREFQEFALADLQNDATVLDLSCGTGLFTRRIAKALPEDARFIAADYSEAMLIEAKRRLLLDKPTGFPDLVRVDVAKLPFASGSIDAIHCGAALHCYPRLEEGLREIRRVLSDDDGKFFATTFLNGAMGTSGRNQRGFRFFDLDELERLLRDAGFDTIDVRREGSFCAVIKAQVGTTSEKNAIPSPSEEDAIPPSSTVPKDSVFE